MPDYPVVTTKPLTETPRVVLDCHPTYWKRRKGTGLLVRKQLKLVWVTHEDCIAIYTEDEVEPQS